MLTVHDLFGIDNDATVALRADLLSRDLVGIIKARSRPVDDPLLHQLADPRRARALYTDGLWIRLVDLSAALSQRRYSCDVDLVAGQLPCPHSYHPCGQRPPARKPVPVSIHGWSDSTSLRWITARNYTT